jgi:hypothetical protein
MARSVVIRRGLPQIPKILIRFGAIPSFIL